MDLGVLELEELILAGDDNAWSMDDWTWDSKAFSATPKPTPTLGVRRAGKRQCSGLQTAFAAFAEDALEAQASCCGTQVDGLAFQLVDDGSPACSCKAPAIAKDDSPEVAKPAAGALPVCQVEGCGKDLSSLSTYYQRCRICETHIKEPQFFRAGKIQRFCQQCGRCHELSAFQGYKRSCKDQLAKHNARRRRRAEKKGAATMAAKTEAQPEALPAISPCSSRLANAFASLGPFLNQPEPATAAAATPETSSAIPVHKSECTAAVLPAPVVAYPEAADQLDMGALEPQLKHDQERIFPGKSAAEAIFAPQLNGSEGDVAPGKILPSGESPESSDHAGEAEQAPENSFEAAMAMMGRRGRAPPPAAAPYKAENLAVRLSVKLFNCTPAELPGDLKRQLTGWLKSTPAGAEGYLRPGCVHLTVQAHVPADTASQIAEGGIQAVAAHLSSQQHQVWRDHVILLELNGQVGLMKRGRLLSTWETAAATTAPQLLQQGAPLKSQPQDPSLLASSSSVAAARSSDASELATAAATIVTPESTKSVLPQLFAVSPAAVCMGAGGEGNTVRLIGQGILCADCTVLCRLGGRYVPVTCKSCGACCQAGEQHSARGPLQTVEIGIPSQLAPGLAWLEVQQGCLLSRAAPLLVAPSRALADELRGHIAAPGEQGAASHEGLLTDLGLLIGGGGTPEALVATAVRLAEHACRADLPELLAYVVDMHPSLLHGAPGEMSLLHLCVQHGSPAAMAPLLRLPAVQVLAPGPQGITPLHLAAVSTGTTHAAAHLLLGRCPASAWISCLTWDGLSPSDFAKQAGALQLDADVSALALAATGQPLPDSSIGSALQAVAADLKDGEQPDTPRSTLHAIASSSSESGDSQDFCVVPIRPEHELLSSDSEEEEAVALLEVVSGDKSEL